MLNFRWRRVLAYVCLSTLACLNINKNLNAKKIAYPCKRAVKFFKSIKIAKCYALLPGEGPPPQNRTVNARIEAQTKVPL